MKYFKILFVCCFLSITITAMAQQKNVPIDSLSFEKTLEYIQATANEFVVDPFTEMSQDRNIFPPGKKYCNYTFLVSPEGLLEIKRLCEGDFVYDKNQEWQVFLKKINLTELDCRDYDIGKSLNYVYLHCMEDEDYCFTKIRDKATTITHGMAIYVQNVQAAQLLHKAFGHLLDLAYANVNYKNSRDLKK